MSKLLESINNFIDSINFIFENRSEYLLKTYGAKLLDVESRDLSSPNYRLSNEDQKRSQQIIEYLGHIDPTNNKQYLQWLVLRYIAGNFKYEDRDRVKRALTGFTQHKVRLPQKDINQYKGIADVEDAVEPLIGQLSQRQTSALEKSEVEKIYDDGSILIVVPKTGEAACYYGKGTKWCTAADSNNMFNHYNEQGLIYILIDKKNNKKYQIHLESHQCMNERDEEVKFKILLETYPEPLKALSNILFKKALSSPRLAYSYVYMISQEPTKELEPIIATDAEFSFDYAENILKGRFPLGEKAIANAYTDGNTSLTFLYARDVIQGPWPPGEKGIATNAFCSFKYATKVLRNRFPSGEPQILSDNAYSGTYLRYLGYNGIDIPEDVLAKYPNLK